MRADSRVPDVLDIFVVKDSYLFFRAELSANVLFYAKAEELLFQNFATIPMFAFSQSYASLVIPSAVQSAH